MFANNDTDDGEVIQHRLSRVKYESRIIAAKQADKNKEYKLAFLCCVGALACIYNQIEFEEAIENLEISLAKIPDNIEDVALRGNLPELLPWLKCFGLRVESLSPRLQRLFDQNALTTKTQKNNESAVQTVVMSSISSSPSLSAIERTDSPLLHREFDRSKMIDIIRFNNNRARQENINDLIVKFWLACYEYKLNILDDFFVKMISEARLITDPDDVRDLNFWTVEELCEFRITVARWKIRYEAERKEQITEIIEYALAEVTKVIKIGHDEIKIRSIMYAELAKNWQFIAIQDRSKLPSFLIPEIKFNLCANGFLTKRLFGKEYYLHESFRERIVNLFKSLTMIKKPLAIKLPIFQTMQSNHIDQLKSREVYFFPD